MISVPRKVRPLVLCEAMAGKTMPRKAVPSKPTEMAAASTMATTPSTVRERRGGRQRQGAGQNQADK